MHTIRVYEKLVMASHANRYPELASYREQIQLSNRKFRWPYVYLFDIQTRMAYATKIFHDSGARPSDLDTTLCATVLGASAAPRHYALTPANVHDASPLTIRSRTVYFPRQKRGKKRVPEMKKNSLWKYPKWYAPSGQEGCNLFQRNVCNQGANCKRAHVWKSCRGDYSAANLSTLYRKFAPRFKLTFGVTLYVPSRTVTL